MGRKTTGLDSTAFKVIAFQFTARVSPCFQMNRLASRYEPRCPRSDKSASRVLGFRSRLEKATGKALGESVSSESVIVSTITHH